VRSNFIRSLRDIFSSLLRDIQTSRCWRARTQRSTSKVKCDATSSFYFHKGKSQKRSESDRPRPPTALDLVPVRHSSPDHFHVHGWTRNSSFTNLPFYQDDLDKVMSCAVHCSNHRPMADIRYPQVSQCAFRVSKISRVVSDCSRCSHATKIHSCVDAIRAGLMPHQAV